MIDGDLLVVNADDWGYDEAANDAIATCHRAGGLTSASAMVFMRGSEQAAARAAEHPELGIGLHLNLVEEYSDPATPSDVRERQGRLIEYFRLVRLRRWVYDPRVRDRANAVIADQFRRFWALYGRAPTHLDGHHHCHLAANVLLSPAVPRGTKIRNALSDTHRRNPLADGLRRLRDGLVAHKYRSTDYFFSIQTVWPALDPEADERKLALSDDASVEIMVHPTFPDEYDVLRSAAWAGAIAAHPLGTFADL